MRSGVWGGVRRAGGASSHLLGEAGVGLEELGRVGRESLHEQLGGDQEVFRQHAEEQLLVGGQRRLEVDVEL